MLPRAARGNRLCLNSFHTDQRAEGGTAQASTKEEKLVEKVATIWKICQSEDVFRRVRNPTRILKIHGFVQHKCVYALPLPLSPSLPHSFPLYQQFLPARRHSWLLGLLNCPNFFWVCEEKMRKNDADLPPLQG